MTTTRSIRAVALLAVAMISAGCAAGVGGADRRPPVRTATLERGDYRTIAACLVDRLRAARTGFARYEGPFDLDGAARITGGVQSLGLATSRAPGPMIPSFDVVVTQQGAGVRIETRGSADEAVVWPLLEGCAGSTVTVRPPL